MNPGDPGSTDESQDGDFLDPSLSINAAKRRRVDEGGMALVTSAAFSSAGDPIFRTNPAFPNNSLPQKMAPLTAAAPSETVSSLSRGAALQEELFVLQKEAAMNGVLAQPSNLLGESPMSSPNRIGQSPHLQAMIFQALEQQRQGLQQSVPQGSAIEQGYGRNKFAAGGMRLEASHDVQGVAHSSFSVPQHGVRIEPQVRSKDKTRGATGPPDLAQRKPTTLLFMEFDVDILSDYQCLVRKNIEIFEAGASEVDSTAKGRNKPILLGQVGIRCRHCSWMDPRERKKGAMYYPAKLSGIYQAAQSLASSHLCKHCDQIPDDVRKQLHILKERKSSAGGGKDYWSDSASIIGVAEDPERGLYYKSKKG